MLYFLPNLKPYTFYRGRGNDRFGGYLLSVDYANSKENRTLARRVVQEGRCLSADNGNVDFIGKFLNSYEDPAKTLARQKEMEEKELKGYVRPGRLSDTLQQRFRELAQTIREASANAFDESMCRPLQRRTSCLELSCLASKQDIFRPQ